MKDISWFAKLSLISLFVFFGLGLVSLSIKYLTPGMPAYSVQQVLEDPGEFDGKNITLYGYIILTFEVYPIEFDPPPSCGYYGDNGSAYLVPDQDIISRPNRWRSAVELESFSCECDDCALECQPCKPILDKRYTFAGTLRSLDGSGKPLNPMTLTEIDFEQTKQQSFIFWLPRLQKNCLVESCD